VNMLTTLLVPTEGTAFIDGLDVVNDSFEVRKRIGYLPENVQLYERMTSYENLRYFAGLSDMRNPEPRIIEVLHIMDADSFKDKKIGECSKGMRQKIGIAQAILHRPQVLFLDEPLAGLDPFGVKNMRNLLVRLNKDTGMTIFMNTHILSEVAETCTSIGILSHGRLIYTDSLERTKHKFGIDKSLEDIYIMIEESSDHHA
jgi:ABC-2 type transport system ATP-binding protein